MRQPMSRVKNWLSNENSGRWLMILDNADDTNLFFPDTKGIARLADYLPKSTKGSILLTTRDRRVIPIRLPA